MDTRSAQFRVISVLFGDGHAVEHHLMDTIEDFGCYTGTTHYEGKPEWGPLERLAADDPLVLGCFAWMGEVRLENGQRVQSYKHADTRRYLHLTEDLRAFEYRGYGGDRYVTVPLAIVLRDCFCHLRELELVEEEEILAAEALIERHTVRPQAA